MDFWPCILNESLWFTVFFLHLEHWCGDWLAEIVLRASLLVVTPPNIIGILVYLAELHSAKMKPFPAPGFHFLPRVKFQNSLTL